ncbi:heterogeneous nuclear ribonucleoprotein U-like protein 1 isoform X2 [Halichondria panicea]|uniref:heterogeneous nuclear ribonucleoprotein U-like protein 1 isoform X2 n=1 Tax=Halichondria panicea TaxID=6063 RepID=UPI00312B7753
MEDIEAYVSKLKVVELREELKKRGLTTAGVKSVLAQRLQEAMSNEIEEDESVPEDQPTEEKSVDSEGVPEDQPTEEQSAEGEGVPEHQSTEEQSAEIEGVAEDQPTEEQSAEGEGRAAEAEVPEGNAETQMEEEPNVEAVQQEEQEGAQSDIKPETQQEPSEPVPSEPEQAEPVADMDTTTTEPTPKVYTGVNQPTPEDDTTKVDASSANDVIPDSATDTTVNLEGDAAVAPDADISALSDGGAENLPKAEEKSAETCDAPVVKESLVKTELEEQKMETDSSDTMAKSENGQDQSESAQIGTKRSHDVEHPVKTEQTKSDPSRAPDPEEPDSFDDSQVLMDSKFQPPEDASIVTLHKYTSDLFFDIREDGLGGCGLSEQGFARLWATTRGSSGVKGGRYYYEVKIEENVSVELPETEEHPHAIRVGWTLDDSKGLGEDNHSFGFGSTGKKVVNNVFESYAESYGPGDVIGCFLDLENSPATISFSKNSCDLSVAFTLEESLSGEAFFPCVSTKNVAFSINFGGDPWCEAEGVEGYALIQAAAEECRVSAPQAPKSVAECEVIMMVGLPASGKTTWAEKHCSKYPEKRYTILGTNLIMERMKVSGLSRKANYKSRFEALIKNATEMLNKLFLLAAKNNRNYIIDQTNVYRNAQERKIKYFEGFVHKAEVVVPPHHELRRRTGLKNEEMGGPLPDDVINAMKANFYIPKAGEHFQDVNYSDIYGIAAEKIVRQYREDALGLPSYPQSKRGRYEYRGNSGSRYEYRGSSGARGGGYSGYSPHQNSSYGSNRSSYSPRGQYGYGGNSYGYQQRTPRYNQYGTPAPPPPMYGNPRGGPYGGPPQHYRSPYSSPGNYRGNYGGQTPPRRGSGYYGRY